MQLQLIRNTTMKIVYDGTVFLTDPMLYSKGQIRSFAGKQKNPIIDLPMPISEIMKDVNAYLVTHTHPDHFDDKAGEVLDKNLPLFCQPVDMEFFKEYGFQDIRPVSNEEQWGNIKLSRTDGQHGSGLILKRMGDVSGFVLQSENEPNIYWVGDSIFYDEVRKNIEKYRPDYVITHSGGAKFPTTKPILMDEKQTMETLEFAPESRVIAIHMEALDHCGITRKKLRQLAEKKGISEDRLIIPLDGEILDL